jgi:hypothetical protein
MGTNMQGFGLTRQGPAKEQAPRGGHRKQPPRRPVRGRGNQVRYIPHGSKAENLVEAPAKKDAIRNVPDVDTHSFILT